MYFIVFNFFFFQRKCKKGEGVMMISLVIDKELDNITPKQKITALKNLAHYLHFPVVS